MTNADSPNTDPSAPVPDAPDDARQRRDQKPERERSPGTREDAKPGTGTFDPMPDPLRRMS
jgi:hypothetical protein